MPFLWFSTKTLVALDVERTESNLDPFGRFPASGGAVKVRDSHDSASLPDRLWEDVGGFAA